MPSLIRIIYIRSISIPESANSSMYIFKNISIPLQILRFRGEGRWFVIYILILSEEGENPNTRETFSWCESTNELFFRSLVSWNSRIRDEIWKFRRPRSSYRTDEDSKSKGKTLSGEKGRGERGRETRDRDTCRFVKWHSSRTMIHRHRRGFVQRRSFALP